jgi:hypothetical protein
MIRTLTVANLITDLLPLTSDLKAHEKSLQNSNRVRARILPRSAEAATCYAPDTISWLRLQSLNTKVVDETNNIITYAVPQLGVTNRPLPGQKKAGFNLFKTIATVTVPARLANFDQFSVEFGPRLSLNQRAFDQELALRLSYLNCHSRTKGRLIFYSHKACNMAVSTDFQALRLSVLKAVPVINVDWLDVDGGWDVVWNPCSSLKPVRKKLEAKLIKFLDQIIEKICASRCDLFIGSSEAFLNATYLSYRDQCQLPKLHQIYKD